MQPHVSALSLPPLVLVALLLLPGIASAQATGLQDPCRHAKANDLDPSNKVCYSVDLTPVTVILANPRLCKAIILNDSNQKINCTATSQGAPSATGGFPIGGGSALQLDLEAQEGWSCVRHTTASSAATVCVLNLYP